MWHLYCICVYTTVQHREHPLRLYIHIYVHDIWPGCEHLLQCTSRFTQARRLNWGYLKCSPLDPRFAIKSSLSACNMWTVFVETLSSTSISFSRSVVWAGSCVVPHIQIFCQLYLTYRQGHHLPAAQENSKDKEERGRRKVTSRTGSYNTANWKQMTFTI